MKKPLLVLSLVLAVAVSGAIVGWIGLFQGDSTVENVEAQTTRDIGARVAGDAEVIAASFVPNLSDADAIVKARDIVRTGMNLPKPEKLPVKVTVALFTGKRSFAPFDFVTDLAVRVVVFDEYPATTRGRVRNRAEYPRYTVILDDGTGERVYSILSWGSK